MPDKLVIQCCAPTLAAIKTGSLFNLPFASRKEFTEGLRDVNHCLAQKGVLAVPLRIREGRALIYLYRPSMLERDLRDPLAQEILREYGYPENSLSRRIIHLIGRLQASEAFPHEIGLFLGYPAVDVRGFIRQEPCKCAGLWKVYESDEEQARQAFTRCKHCTGAYMRRYQQGWSLSRLTIRSRQIP